MQALLKFEERSSYSVSGRSRQRTSSERSDQFPFFFREFFQQNFCNLSPSFNRLGHQVLSAVGTNGFGSLTFRHYGPRANSVDLERFRLSGTAVTDSTCWSKQAGSYELNRSPAGQGRRRRDLLPFSLVASNQGNRNRLEGP